MEQGRSWLDCAVLGIQSRPGCDPQICVDASVHSHPPTEPSSAGAFLEPDLPQGSAQPGAGGAADADEPCPVDAVQYHPPALPPAVTARHLMQRSLLCLGLLQGSDILKGIFQAS